MEDDQSNVKETEQRLEKLLRGAFAGAPTPLKDIPKKIGVTRVARSKKPKTGASDASAKTARPGI
jgi:hypothetical protein